MQSTVISISSSSPFLKPRNPFPNPNSTLRLLSYVNFSPISSSSRRLSVVRCSADFSGFNLSRRSGSKFDGLISLPSLKNSPENSDVVVVRAAAVPESGGAGAGDEVPKTAVIGKSLELGLLFGAWYLFNIYFNIYNKQEVLRCKCHPSKSFRGCAACVMVSVSSQPQFRYTQTLSKLHLRNLPWECTEKELIELGKPFGKLENYELAHKIVISGIQLIHLVVQFYGRIYTR